MSIRIWGLYRFFSSFLKKASTPRQAPWPLNISSLSRMDRVPHGASGSIPWSLHQAMSLFFHLVRVSNGLMAPWLIERPGSGTTRSGSTACILPNPVHSGHAPADELKENRAGEGGLKCLSHLVQCLPLLKVVLEPLSQTQ